MTSLNVVESQALTIGKVPVRNLWLLMLYASDLYRELGKQFSSVEDAPDEIPDLIARMLCQATEKRLRRNLSLGYMQRNAHLNRLRGRIDVLETARHNLFSKGQIACRFDELTVNTPRNRYIKAALEKLSSVVSHQGVSKQCRSLARQLYVNGVTGTKPEPSELSKETFGRHDAEDRQLISLANLAFELALPTEQYGKHHIQSPDRAVTFVRKLFEKGVAGLYEVNLRPKGWKVRAGKKLDWQVEDSSNGIAAILPSMTTDIELDNGLQHIVIDTKFNSVLTKGWYKDKTLRSGYLYQMYAYLRSQERSDNPKSLNSIGILLHPCISEPLDEQVTIQGHQIRFVTLDLTLPANKMKQELIQIVASS